MLAEAGALLHSCSSDAGTSRRAQDLLRQVIEDHERSAEGDRVSKEKLEYAKAVESGAVAFQRLSKWQSEEKAIWYDNPITKRKARYFPDFIVEYERSDGITMQEMVEIKPARQVEGPPTNPKRRTKAWMNAVMTYAQNMAKWKAARRWCEDRGMNFRIVTEKELGLLTK